MLYKKNSQNNIKDRDTAIDIVKGIGIILMVWGHACGPFKHWIYLFHMAIFFIASGILYNNMNSINPHRCKTFLIRKTRSLWLPFVLCNASFNLMHNFFLKTGIYSDNPQFIKMVTGSGNYLQKYRKIPETLTAIIKNILFAGGSQLGGATWFLRTLFQISCIYMVIIYIMHKFDNKKLIIFASTLICTICATVISTYKINLPLGLHSLFASFLAFLTGAFLHNTNFICKLSKYKYRIIITCFLLLCLLNKIGKINMSSGKITNVVFFLICSIAGWFMLYSIALCKGIRENKLLIYIGQHTLSILLLHFLAFKIVTWIYILTSNNNMLLLAAFPVIKNVPFLWIPYTFCGIVFPLIADNLFTRCKNIIYKQKDRLYKEEDFRPRYNSSPRTIFDLCRNRIIEFFHILQEKFN